MPLVLLTRSTRYRAPVDAPQSVHHVNGRDCGQERLPDLLSIVCIPAGLPLTFTVRLEWHRLQDEDHPLVRQAAFCDLMHFESPFRYRFEPLPRLPPAFLFALAGVIRSRGV
jgi:hypothetical protein